MLEMVMLSNKMCYNYGNVSAGCFMWYTRTVVPLL